MQKQHKGTNWLVFFLYVCLTILTIWSVKLVLDQNQPAGEFNETSLINSLGPTSGDPALEHQFPSPEDRSGTPQNDGHKALGRDVIKLVQEAPSNADPMAVAFLRNPIVFRSDQTARRLTVSSCLILALGITILWALFWILSLRRLIRRKTADLQTSEKKYRQLIDQATTGLAVIQDMRFVYLNPLAEQILDWHTKGTRNNRDLMKIIHPLDREMVSTRYDELLKGSETKIQMEIRILPRNGEEMWVRMTSVKIEWEDSPAILLVFTNVNEEKKLQESIRTSEELYRQIFSQLPVGLFYYDSELKVTNVNERFAEMMHFPYPISKTIDGRTLKDAKILDTLKRAFAHENGFFEGWTRPHKSNEQSAYIRLHTTPLYNNKGECQGGIGLLEDLTSQIVNEQKIHNLEESFSKAFLASPDAININSLQDGRFVDVNQGFIDFSGLKKDEIIGRTSAELHLWADPKGQETLIKEIQKNGECKNLEMKFRSKNGKIRTGLVSSSIVEIDGEKCILSITRDIEEIKKTEERIINSELRYRTIFESVPVSIWEQNLQDVFDMLEELRKKEITDLNQYLEEHPDFVQEAIKTVKVIDVNEPSLKIYKAENKEQLFISLDKLFIDDSKINFKKELLAIWNHESFFDGDSVNIDLEGNRIHVNVVMRIPKTREEFKNILVCISDITQRKMAEEALRESEARYRTIFNSVPLSIKEQDFSVLNRMIEELRESGIVDFDDYVVKHPDWVKKAAHSIKVNVVNQESLRIFKAKEKEQLLESLDIYFTEESYSGFKRLLTAMWNHQPEFEQENINRTLTGELINIWMSISFPTEPAGFSRVLVTIQDITERKRAEEQIRTQVKYLAALRAVDMAISASMELPITLRVLLNQAQQQLNADSVSILILDTHTQTLRYAAGIGFQTNAVEATNLRLGQSYGGQAALERRIITAENLAGKGSLLYTKGFDKEGFTHYIGIPLISKGTVKGVLELFNHRPFESEAIWMNLLESMAGQAAIAIENATLMDEVQRVNLNLRSAYDATIEGWARSVDLRSGDTEQHAKRVADLTVELAQAAGFHGEGLLALRRGAMLHDIGKFGIPESILLKPASLTDEEWKIMKTHPVIAKRLLNSIDFLQSSVDIPYFHHERWDGKGYPEGIKGEEIPFAARVFAIVDSWDSLRSERPWRKAWTDDNAWEYIESNAGKAFDPKIVDRFKQFMGHGFSEYF